MRFKKAETQFEYFSLMQIRAAVFMCEQSVDPLIEIDDEDKTCDQFVVYDNDEIIGTCRVLKHGSDWHIGRVAVLKEHRKKHCGSFMLNEVEKIAKESGVKKLELGAQVAAMPFYENNGYRGYGDIYLDADIDHMMMEKRL